MKNLLNLTFDAIYLPPFMTVNINFGKFSVVVNSLFLKNLNVVLKGALGHKHYP